MLNDNFTTVYNCDENIKLKGYTIKGTAANLFVGMRLCLCCVIIKILLLYTKNDL